MSHDFSKYDVIFHVAGIAHIKETKENKHLYYKVNRDLAIEVAKKSKKDKVKQFILMSSMSVYGIGSGEINQSTPTKPKTAYGKSKLQAEEEIVKLQSNNFNVVVLRPPMVYGPGSKGNYSKLSNFAVKSPLFPNFENKRSMVFIDNLSIFIKDIIDKNKKGLFFPQNEEYIATTKMVKEISSLNGKSLRTTKLFNPVIKLLMNISVINKVFGSLYYKEIPSYNSISFQESLRATESKNNEDVWFFHHYATPPSMNGFTRPYYFSKNLTSKGYSSRTFTSSYLHFSDKQLIKNKSKYKTINEDGVEFVFVKTNSGNSGISRLFNMVSYYLNTIKISKQFIKKYGKPKTIIGSSPHPLALLAGLKISKRYNINYITEVRDFWPEVFFTNEIISENGLIGKILLRGEKYIYKNSDALIFLKEGDYNYLIERKWNKESGGPIDLKKVNYINNGVDTVEFIRNSNQIKFQDDDLKSNKFKVIYAGTIRPVNDVGMLVKAANLLKEYTDIEFLIFGEGNQLNDLKSMSKELGLINIKFKGYVDRKYMPYVLTQSSVNILNYSQEKYNWSRGNSSNKFFEYMASGKPIISTVKMGYCPLEKYNIGLSIDEYTEATLANTILRIYNLDRYDYEKMSKRAIDAAKDFDYKKLTNDLINILEKVND